MAKQEIQLQGIDGQVEELILTTKDGAIDITLEDCARMLFPQEGEAVPRLRFKGFEGAWEKKLLSDCLEISDERNTDNRFGVEDVLSVSDDYGVVNQIEHLGRSYAGKSVSGYKILRPGQIVYTKSPLSAKPFGIVKHNTGKAGIVSVLYAVYNPKEGIAPEYIHYYFDPAWRLNAYLRPLVNKGAKNTMNISDETALTGYIMIPKDIEEQRQIARFLERLDAQIENYQQQFDNLKQMKTACLDIMFPRENKAVPPMRFKGFEGEWTITKLCQISKKVTTKNTDLKYRITLTNSAEQGIVNQLDFFDHEISKGDNIRGYTVVENDDFVYNPRVSVTAPVGPVNRNQLGYTGVMSPLYYVFRVEGIDRAFLSYYFKTKLWHKFMYDNGNNGARFDRFSISDEVFGQMPIIHPKDIEEQKKIAGYLRNLDEQILSQQQQLERLKQMKQACLGLLFPDNQSITPLRFKGFSGKWIVRQLASIASFSKGKGYSKNDLQETGTPIILYGRMYTRYSTIIDDVDTYVTRKPNSVLSQGNEIIIPASGETPEDIACASVVQKEGVILGGDLNVIRLTDSLCDSHFTALSITYGDVHKELAKYAQGKTVVHLHNSEICKVSIAYPPTIEEQRCIASFIQTIDNRIALLTKQVMLLDQIKKACINQMIA